MTTNWPISRIWIYRELAFEMTKRELLALHKGSILGYSWLFLSPLIQTIAYITIASGVMQNSSSNDLTRIAWILAGMGTWQIFSKTLSDAPSIILGRIDIIKQVYFPLELLPLPKFCLSLVSGFFLFFIALFIQIYSGSFSQQIILLPFVLILIALFLIPLSWIFGIVGVVMKDLRELIGILLSFLIFTSPAIFPPDGPSNSTLRFLMDYNPITPFIQIVLCCFGAPTPQEAWLKSFMLTVLSLLIGSKILVIAKNKISELL